MSIKLKEKGKPARLQDIKSFEHQTGISLPDDYRSFVLQNNGAVPETNEFNVDEKCGSGVNEFLSLSEIIETKKRFSDRFLSDAWPIAFAEGGNYVCLVIGIRSGVYFWDHEFEAEEGELATWHNMSYLADSFDAFFTTLRKFDMNTVELKPDQIQKVWVNPDFKPEF